MTKLLPFDLEAAKAGATVVTRGGRPARIVCWDVRDDNLPLVVVMMDKITNQEYVTRYNPQGQCSGWREQDLFLAPTPVKRWRVVYRGADDNAAQRDFEDFDDAAKFARQCDKNIHVFSTDPFTVEITP